MQRIVKRFLLYQQRESDEVYEADFDELKQDVQMIRFEITDELKRTFDDNQKCLNLINSGIGIIGDEILKDSHDEEKVEKLKQLRLITRYSSDSGENEIDESNTESLLADTLSTEISLKSAQIDDKENYLLKTISTPNISDSSKSNDQINFQNKRLNFVKNKLKHMNRSKTMSLIELNVINEEEENNSNQDGKKSLEKWNKFTIKNEKL